MNKIVLFYFIFFIYMLDIILLTKDLCYYLFLSWKQSINVKLILEKTDNQWLDFYYYYKSKVISIW